LKQEDCHKKYFEEKNLWRQMSLIPLMPAN
jgi:hypothetical protein